ncbi:hypothetical protein BGZ61DRAFT_446033 [Ilyonectria robusta]|uniref:uncharacterized protein n=1 Tax=Ilyonectria robusta TaxID=1079257 RepID=UPI001E8E4120|nr:uncharacterized protein BGZ61DRAFT_446033 [Ilyonectria robusta]KAH8729245.1 hypothetical protein BGZ61DRAFT_446033 [Ilyonectria robusta]
MFNLTKVRVYVPQPAVRGPGHGLPGRTRSKRTNTTAPDREQIPSTRPPFPFFK